MAIVHSSERIREVFRRFDTSNDKIISRVELKRVLQVVTEGAIGDEDLDKLLAGADQSGDGGINYEEFVSWVFGSQQGRWLEREGEKLLDRPEPPLDTAFGRVHVLIVEGSSHPGRLLGTDQFVGLPLHFDLLDAAFRRLRGAAVRTAVSPRKAEVPELLRRFAASVPPGDLSLLLFTGHGVQAGGEEHLVFESRSGVRTFNVEPLRDASSGAACRPGEFRLRERMQHIDGQISEHMGPDWLHEGWTITEVDGVHTNESQYNHAVVEAGKSNQPFEVTFSRGEKTVDYVSYDELRALFAGKGPCVHLIDACRVVHDDALGFRSDERPCDAAAAREGFLREHPVPPNVVTVFAVKPGSTAMHEGAGRNYDSGKLGHELESEGLLHSEYAQRIKEAWERANEEDGALLQYYTSFFVEAFVECLGELHLEGPTACVGDLLRRMTCCPFGRMRQMRGFRTFVGDQPVLEAGSNSSEVDDFALCFQGDAFFTPEVADE